MNKKIIRGLMVVVIFVLALLINAAVNADSTFKETPVKTTSVGKPGNLSSSKGFTTGSIHTTTVNCIRKGGYLSANKICHYSLNKIYLLNGFPKASIPSGVRGKATKFGGSAKTEHILAYIFTSKASGNDIAEAIWASDLNEGSSKTTYRNKSHLYHEAVAYSAWKRAYVEPTADDSSFIENNGIIGPFSINYVVKSETFKKKTYTFGNIQSAYISVGDTKYEVGNGWMFVDGEGNNETKSFPESDAKFGIKITDNTIIAAQNKKLNFTFKIIDAKGYYGRYTGSGTRYGTNISTTYQTIAVHGGTRDELEGVLDIELGEGTKFDLALRKYITAVNGQDLTEYGGSRDPDISTDTLETGTTATYNHKKDPVEVNDKDIVTYKITLYNEGSVDGRALEVIDQLPSGLEFVEVKSGNFTGEAIDGNKVKFTRKSDNTTNLKAYDTEEDGDLDSETIEFTCKVKAEDAELMENQEDNLAVLTNVAWISSFIDVDGKKLDRDSSAEKVPDTSNLPPYRGTTSEDKELDDEDYFYKGQEDDDDFEKLVVEKIALSISGIVWQDVLQDKAQAPDGKMNIIDGGDRALENITVYLYNANGELYNNGKTKNPTKTDNEGKYIFNNLEEGTYTVGFGYDGLSNTTTVKDTSGGEYISTEEDTSKAEETEEIRKSFNDKFNLISKNLATGKNGGTLVLEYNQALREEIGLLESKLIRYKEDKYLYEMLVKTDKIVVEVGDNKLVAIENVNLGLVERYVADFMIVQDLIEGELTVNGEIVPGVNISLEETSDTRIREAALNQEVLAELNKRSVTVDIKEEYISENLGMNLTYKMIVLNSSEMAVGKLTEIVEYTKKAYGTPVASWWIDSGGNKKELNINVQSVDNDDTINRLVLTGFDELELARNGMLKLYLKFNVTANDFFGDNKLKDKTPIVVTSEISKYSFNNSKNDEKYVNGQIDYDSAPDNSIYGPEKIEDDTANAPSIRIKIDTLTTIDDGDRAISGIFWEDTNRDGIMQDGEPRIEGAKVELLTKSGERTDRDPVTTDKSGRYIFSNVPEGEFIVKFNYGDNKETADAMTAPNAEKSYTGNTYRSTDKWGDFVDLRPYTTKDAPAIEINRSNARDDADRRAFVNENSKVVGYAKGKILASPFNGTYDKDNNGKNLASGFSMFALSYVVDTTDEPCRTFYTTDGNGNTILDAARNAIEKQRADNFNRVKKAKRESVNFGIVSRDTTDITTTKTVTDIKLISVTKQLITHYALNDEGVMEYIEGTAKNITTIGPNVATEDNPNPKVKYYVTISDENTDDSILQVTYKITIVNNGTAEVSINNILDYIDPGAEYDSELNDNKWTMLDDISKITDGSTNSNVVVSIVPTKQDGKTYEATIITTSIIDGDAEEIGYINMAEVAEYTTTGAADPDVIPGDSKGPDSDKAEEVFATGPSGEQRIYYVLGFTTLLILTLGIMLINGTIIKSKK